MISVVSLYFSRGNKCDESVKVTTLIFLFFEIFLTAFNLKTGFRSGLIIKTGILTLDRFFHIYMSSYTDFRNICSSHIFEKLSSYFDWDFLKIESMYSFNCLS